MPELADRIADARAELKRLERIAATATCRDLGHNWQSIGGCNCGCHEDASCSVPVNECARCKDCNYGENEDAHVMRESHYHQPRLMDHWGCEFFGEAETTTGDVWWYEDRQDDGSVRRVPLLPMAPEAVKNNP